MKKSLILGLILLLVSPSVHCQNPFSGGSGVIVKGTVVNTGNVRSHDRHSVRAIPFGGMSTCRRLKIKVPALKS